MTSPRTLILKAPGTTGDAELAFAFERAGAISETVHVDQLREKPDLLRDFEIFAIPGGFTYGDEVMAGKILALQMSTFLADELQRFRDSEKLILGICNGFQALLLAGLLVPPDEEGHLVNLTRNLHERFEARWVNLIVNSDRCPWLKGIEKLFCPVAHGEGKFHARSAWIVEGLKQAGQIVLQYAGEDGQPTQEFPHNPSGSQGAVAGLCDASGQVLGLMPHPERHVLPTHHPHWTREGLNAEGEGLAIFRNAVAHFHL